MIVRPKKRAPVHKFSGDEPTPKPQAQPFSFPAPIRGWVLDDSLANPQAGGASILDNWICTSTGIRARGGKQKYATLDAAVSSLFTYKSGVTETFFGATATKIYDITTIADPDVVPSAAITGQTDGYYSYEQFGTAGGDYLYAVNGTDSPQLYDGSAWTAITGVSSPAITGVTPSELSHVWSFANRLFFVRKDTKTAWYLPVDSIGGAASEFSLAGIFKKGGSLLFGATWSLDAGDGLDDKCVFVSTEGEAAVYEGTNPGSASTWGKVGVYQITKPLGKNATMQAGGDLLVATELGIVPISEAVRRDVASLSLGAVSSKIAPYWQKQAGVLSTHPWEVLKWPQKNIMIVSQPASDTDEGSCLVANLQTGSWSRITGWVTRCLGYFDEYGYFGSADSAVYKMEVGGSDDGANYTCTYLGQHESLGAVGMQKTITQARASFQSSTPILPKVSAQTDFSQITSGIPASPISTDIDVWDVGKWDIAKWDIGGAVTTNSLWTSVGKTGHVVAPEVQLTFGYAAVPVVELVSIDVEFHVGARVA